MTDLVEADALLERGDLRGELIIVQTALAEGGFDRARGIALRRREKELLAAHIREWAPTDEWLSLPIFRRGVVVGGTVKALDFLAHEEEIVFRYPHFSHLRLTLVSEGHGEAVLEQVLASGRITGLEIDQSVGRPIVPWLEESGQLAKLESFVGTALDADEVTRLLARPKSFVELGLLYVEPDGPIFDAFERTKQRPRRIALVARDDDDARAALRLPFFREVEELTISLPPRLLMDLELPSLRVLRFFWGAPEGVGALLASPIGQQLEAIQFRRGQHGFEPTPAEMGWDGVVL